MGVPGGKNGVHRNHTEDKRYWAYFNQMPKLAGKGGTWHIVVTDTHTGRRLDAESPYDYDNRRIAYRLLDEMITSQGRATPSNLTTDA